MAEQEKDIPIGLTWGENRNREPDQVHVEWHAPCGCAFHPKPFPHVHPCTNEHKRPDLHTLTEETERELHLRRRRAFMPDYDKRLKDWLSWMIESGEMDWQPIETAPRMKVVLGFWEPNPGSIVTPECYGLCQQLAGEWESADGESWAAPDAWMPLPDPPEQSK